MSNIQMAKERLREGMQHSKYHDRPSCAQVLTEFRRHHPCAKPELSGISVFCREFMPDEGEYTKTRLRKNHPLYHMMVLQNGGRPEGIEHVPHSKMLNLRGANLQGAFISWRIAKFCDFRGADLRGALIYTDFRYCLFNNADLRGTTFVNAYMDACDAREARFDDAVFVGGQMGAVRVEGASFRGTKVRHLRDPWGEDMLEEVFAETLSFFSLEKGYHELSYACRRRLWAMCNLFNCEDLEAAGDLDEFAQIYPGRVRDLDMDCRK